MSRTFVIGDIHGALQAFRQCLFRAGFDHQNDRLICLGDVCDGWPETKACVDELLSIADLIYILGNHDLCALEWMRSGEADDTWLTQGGDATIQSYQDGIPPDHLRFFQAARLYHLETGKLFVHAGIDPHRSLQFQTRQTFLWDRRIAHKALDLHARKVNSKITQYDEVYIGHTPIDFDTPLFSNGVWLMDTGAGWSGTLSLMDVHTKDVYTSDPVPSLYPDTMGRSVKAG
jgi:serine/threonine protein phosphatase 1